MRFTYNQAKIIAFLIVGLIAGFNIHQQTTQRIFLSAPYTVESFPIIITDNIQYFELPDIVVIDKKEIKHYKDLTDPRGIGKPEYFKDLFKEVSLLTGVDKQILMKFAVIESSLNPKANANINVKASHAKGLFQFTPDTWRDVVKKYGKDYGIHSEHLVLDARANALMAGFHIQSNIQLLKEKTNLNKITTTDIYLTHLLGRSGSLKYLKMSEKEYVVNKMNRAARNNRKFFFDKGKALTKEESYITINQHIQNKVKEFGINV